MDKEKFDKTVKKKDAKNKLKLAMNVVTVSTIDRVKKLSLKKTMRKSFFTHTLISKKNTLVQI